MVKRPLLVCLTFFLLLSCGEKKDSQDPYAIFEKETHFRPKLDKGNFYGLHGYDFGWFVLEPISDFVQDKDHEMGRMKQLSPGQKALYFWWLLDAEVTNGGFVQFYYKGYGRYVPALLKGMGLVGDPKMKGLIQEADSIYKINQQAIEKADKEDQVETELQDEEEEMTELDALDEKYYALHDHTMALLEQYIRQHPNEICVDEEEKEFNMHFSGNCKTHYPNQKTKELFHLENGKVTGEFKRFYENGPLKESIAYQEGTPTGEWVEYFENGKVQFRSQKDVSSPTFRHQWFYENGNPKKLEHIRQDNNERLGEYKEWYENGQLSETGRYVSNLERTGKWVEFYPNGHKKVEAEFKNGEFLLHDHWNEQGEHTLKEGTGIYVYETKMHETYVRNEHEYKNYRRHGKQKTYTNGILTLYQEMKDGLEDGYTRDYDTTGKLEEEILYQKGEVVSKRDF